MDDLNHSVEFEEKVRRAVDVSDANPEFINRLRNELVRRPAKMKSHFMFKPAWAIVLVLILAVLLATLPGVAAAIGRLIGYVPDVGLVENTGDLRVLAEPVSVAREGITLTIDYVYVYADHVELSYSVTGISAQNDGTQAEDKDTTPTAFCGGVNIGEVSNTDGDARLRLPDGTLLERMFGTKYPQNIFATKPVYETAVPADVREMTLVLKCIPWARLGAVPENWEVPFKLIPVPEGTIMGAPVIDVPPTSVAPSTVEPTTTAAATGASIPAPVVTMTLQKIVPLDSAIIVYISMDMEDRDLSLVSIMPVDVYMVDSQGQKIDLIGGYTWQPYEHPAGSLFEFRSASKPAEGPLTIVVENAVSYYMPLHVDVPQATPEEMSFTFDAGTDPQRGQTWELNDEFTIGGYPLKVTSARAVIWDDVKEPSYIDGSQGFEFGYQFMVASDPSVKMSVKMDIMLETLMCGLSVGDPFIPDESSLLYTQLCRGEFPKGTVKTTIWELAVLLENTWQTTWTP